MSSGMGTSEIRHLTINDFITSQVIAIKESFEEKLVERDEQTKLLLWLAEVLNADPELAEQFKKSAIKYNIK